MKQSLQAGEPPPQERNLATAKETKVLAFVPRAQVALMAKAA